MRTIHQRLDKIFPKIADPSFRENRGLGNEIGYHIFDYEPENEMLVREHIAFLKERTEQDPLLNLRIIEFDLYEIVLNILDEKKYLEKNFAMEKKKGSKFVLNATRKALRLTLENDLVIQYMAERVKDYNLIFITGIGKVFPIIRSHVILNNLHRAVGEKTVILFFPGRYDGQELVLFGEVKDDNYYRAFQLID